MSVYLEQNTTAYRHCVIHETPNHMRYTLASVGDLFRGALFLDTFCAPITVDGIDQNDFREEMGYISQDTEDLILGVSIVPKNLS